MRTKSIWTVYKLNVKYAFRPRKPLLTLRLAWRLFEVHFLKRRPLRYVDTAIHYHCNLSCEHCFATQLQDKKRKQLTLADYARIAEESMKAGAVNFSFQGGEPTINLNQLISIIQQFKPWKNLISVTTNATLLTENKIDRLRKAGVDILTISLDSGVAAEHDKFRGQSGAFDKVMQTIEYATSHGLNVTIGATVFKGNLYSDGIKRLIEFCENRGIILFFSLAAPAGNWKDNYDGLLSEQDMAHIRELERTHTYLRTDFNANWLHHGCGAVKEILYLTPYGDIFPCPYLHFSLGNILEESVSSIRERSMTLPYLKDYYPTCLCAEDKEFICKYMPIINKHTSEGKIPHYTELF